MALKIIIRRMYPYEGEGTTKAFFDVKIQTGQRVLGFNDMRLVKNRESGVLFASHPAKPGEDGQFFDYSYTDGKTKNQIEKAALAAYNRALKEKEEGESHPDAA